MTIARTLFTRARLNATYRGIEFHFSFDEWVEWWEQNLGPNWMQRRGCRTGQFVMARNSDVGPYAKWNVRCIAHVDNCKERKNNGTTPKGEKHGNSKLLLEEVHEIRRSPLSSRKLARKFEVSQSLIVQVKNGKWWKED